jgi:protein TonB
VALIVTVAVSLGLHLVALAVALLLLRTAVPVADLPDKATEVELVMEEHKGDLAPTASTPSPPRTATATPSKQQAEPVAPPEEAQPAETPSPPAKPPVDARSNAPQETAEPAVASIPAPQATPTPEQPVRPSPEPTPPAAQPAPKISLQGTDSPSDARAWGEHVIPASPDAVFHNRPPEYPTESVLRGERGTVVVVVHVSPAGTAEGVDVLHSSGYALLDGAVRVAVMRWRFLPAVKAGASVASDVTMGFIFDNN